MNGQRKTLNVSSNFAEKLVLSNENLLSKPTFDVVVYKRKEMGQWGIRYMFNQNCQITAINLKSIQKLKIFPKIYDIP